jgi:hypothetical protein
LPRPERIAAPGDAVLAGSFQVFGTANIENSLSQFVLNLPATSFEDQIAGDVYKRRSSIVISARSRIATLLLQSPAHTALPIAVNNEGNEAPACT